tara:strand:+ start:1038 stop:1151 length:114 start_codon:yes stop_codon:yes gene_type:complete
MAIDYFRYYVPICTLLAVQVFDYRNLIGIGIMPDLGA